MALIIVLLFKVQLLCIILIIFPLVLRQSGAFKVSTAASLTNQIGNCTSLQSHIAFVRCGPLYNSYINNPILQLDAFSNLNLGGKQV
jgi:hypothetical protein